MDRNLDGYYFRVERDGRWESVCFSDLTEEEMDVVLQGRNEQWLKSLCKGLGVSLKKLGDTFNIVSVEEGDEED